VIVRRTDFKARMYIRPPKAPLVPVASCNSGPSAKPVVSVAKDAPRRSEKYRRWVASLACAHCKRPGPSQCAHSDEGKGLALKAGDDTCFPLCADGPERSGCHSLIGASGVFTREHRRLLERTYAARTRDRAVIDGIWPDKWTLW
jgi:hypothetical protein